MDEPQETMKNFGFDALYTYYTSPRMYKILFNKYSLTSEIPKAKRLTELKSITQSKSIEFEDLIYIQTYQTFATHELFHLKRLLKISIPLILIWKAKSLFEKKSIFLFLDNNRYFHNKLKLVQVNLTLLFLSLYCCFFIFHFFKFSTSVVFKNLILLEEELNLINKLNQVHGGDKI